MGGIKDTMQKLHEGQSARQLGEKGIRKKYDIAQFDAENAAGYANWAAKDYVSKYGDTGRNDTAGSTRSEDIARGGGTSSQSKKAKRLFSDMVDSGGSDNLISA